MKTIFKTLAIGLLLTTVASCDKHDPFDENTITGAVGPEAKWEIASSAVKSGEYMGFVGKYYSTVAGIDHSEVWYELFEKEDKLVSASLIQAFNHSVTSNASAQKRALQTIQSYPHSEDLWDETERAYILTDQFPVSYTLAPISWVQPKDTMGFNKNLIAYFGENFAKEFKDQITLKMNPSAEERNYRAYMQVINGLGLLIDTIVTPNGDRMPFVQWMIDSTYNANTASWEKDFKRMDTIWSKEEFDTLDIIIKDTFSVSKPDRTGKRDTTYYTDTAYITHPVFLSAVEVYSDIKHAIDSVWENHVTFYNLIQNSEGAYSIEYKREYYINAELRIYDEKGTYSKTDTKQIAIN